MLQQGSNGRIDFGVHKHKVLPVLDRHRGDLRAVFNMAGDLDQTFQQFRRAERLWVRGDGTLAGANRVIEFRCGFDNHDVGLPSSGIDLDGRGDRAVADGCSRDAVEIALGLVDRTLGHRTCSEHAKEHRLAQFMPSFQRLIDNDHCNHLCFRTSVVWHRWYRVLSNGS